MTMTVQPTASRYALTHRRKLAWALFTTAITLMILRAVFEGKPGTAPVTVDTLARLAPGMILLAVYWGSDELGRLQALRATAVAALVTLTAAPLVCLEAAVGVLFTITALLMAASGLLAVARARLHELREGA